VDILKEFLETIMQFKHQTPKPKFCPMCKSHKVILKETYGALPQIYNCKDCEYEGLIIFEITPEELR
jgi:hypothetical protein